MKIIDSKGAPKAIGPYSQAVVNGNMIFLSGQIPINPESGNVDAKSIEDQTSRVLNNLKAVLIAGGADLASVVRCTVFLTDLSDFVAFNKVYSSFFPSNPPARTTVQVSKLPRDAKIEIDAIAVMD